MCVYAVLCRLYTGWKPVPAGGGGHGGSTKLLPVILTCIPYTLAAISSYCIAHSSQKMQELYFHTALPAVVGGASSCDGLILGFHKFRTYSPVMCRTKLPRGMFKGRDHNSHLANLSAT